MRAALEAADLAAISLELAGPWPAPSAPDSTLAAPPRCRSLRQLAFR